MYTPVYVTALLKTTIFIRIKLVDQKLIGKKQRASLKKTFIDGTFIVKKDDNNMMETDHVDNAMDTIDQTINNSSTSGEISHIDLPKSPTIEESDDSQHASIFIDAEQSSFEETLGVIPNTDDPTILCLTIRSWICGLFLIIVYSFVGQYYTFRSSSSILSATIIVGLSYPIGHFLAWILPKRTWFAGRRFAFSLNPGPFTIKEHTIIYNMVWLSAISTVPLNILPQLHILSSTGAKDIPPMPHYAVGLIFVISAQLIGFGLAGILRRLLVWPSEMIWPWNLPYLITIRTLHETESPLTPRWLGLTRRRFFVIVLILSFCYQWISRFIFPMLDFFPWWCLINQRSVLLSQLTGPKAFAMGLLPLDWGVIGNALRTPIIVPAWAHVNIGITFLLIGWLIIPLLYYTNVANWARLPVTGTTNYKLMAHPGQTQKTVTHAVVTYCYFGAILALFLHTCLFHGRDLIKYARTSLHNRQNDVHCTLIGKYKEAPGWVYGILFFVTLIALCLTCHFGKLMSWYYVLVAVSLVVIYTIPSNILRAQSAIYIDPDLIIYIISGLMLRTQPLAHATFFTITWGMQDQASVILQNFKLAHYVKIAPQSMFIVQLVSTIVTSTTTYIVTRYLLSNISGICTTNTLWSCPNIKTFYTLFPRTDFDQLYGLKSVYPWLLWVMIGIAIMPFFVWLARRFWPTVKWLHLVHIPIMFVYLRYLESPGVGYLQIPVWLLVGLLFRYFIPRWWFDRYGFLFSLTITMGDRFTRMFLFLIFTNRNQMFPSWWGTTTNVCPLSVAAANGSLVSSSV